MAATDFVFDSPRNKLVKQRQLLLLMFAAKGSVGLCCAPWVGSSVCFPCRPAGRQAGRAVGVSLAKCGSTMVGSKSDCLLAVSAYQGDCKKTCSHYLEACDVHCYRWSCWCRAAVASPAESGGSCSPSGTSSSSAEPSRSAAAGPANGRYGARLGALGCGCGWPSDAPPPLGLNCAAAVAGRPADSCLRRCQLAPAPADAAEGEAAGVASHRAPALSAGRCSACAGVAAAAAASCSCCSCSWSSSGTASLGNDIADTARDRLDSLSCCPVPGCSVPSPAAVPDGRCPPASKLGPRCGRGLPGGESRGVAGTGGEPASDLRSSLASTCAATGGHMGRAKLCMGSIPRAPVAGRCRAAVPAVPAH